VTKNLALRFVAFGKTPDYIDRYIAQVHKKGAHLQTLQLTQTIGGEFGKSR
jgi:hypothetical protein